jgi:hypothetical protein
MNCGLVPALANCIMTATALIERGFIANTGGVESNAPTLYSACIKEHIELIKTRFSAL